MKEIDIVFNIDYPAEKEFIPFHTSMPIYIEYLCVNNMEQFRRLLSALHDLTRCYVWVHSSFNSTRAEMGMKSDIEIQCIPELTKFKIEFKHITRSLSKADNKTLFDANQMLEYKKGMKVYTARELRAMLNPATIPATGKQLTNRLIESLSGDVEKTNERLKQIRQFLAEAWNAEKEGMWYCNLFPEINEEVRKIFGSRYWRFQNKPMCNFLNLTDTHSGLIAKEVTKVQDIIVFDDAAKKWQIDFSFFEEVSNRFESVGNGEYKERLMIAGCLYVFHESLHKVHNLDNNNVQGIGNFPRIVEEADYQADAIAILIEIAFFIKHAGGLQAVSSKQLGEKLCETIRVAIETTFSFNPVGDTMKRIQVRRVNRYLIWFWQYFRILSLMKSEKPSEELLIKVLSFFSVKPNVEITGPAIVSSQSYDRTYYELDDIRHRELLAVMREDNEIIRLAPTSDLLFQSLYNGIRESDFEKVLSFLTKLFANYRSTIDLEL